MQGMSPDLNSKHLVMLPFMLIVLNKITGNAQIIAKKVFPVCGTGGFEIERNCCQ